MKRALVLVEGQTEERFVNECLAPRLLDHGLVVATTIVKTKRVVGSAHFKGGVRSYGQVERDLKLLLRDADAAVITTLLDYYALPTDFPGMRDRPTGSPRARVEHVETAWAASIADARFVPHLVLHELGANRARWPRTARCVRGRCHCGRRWRPTRRRAGETPRGCAGGDARARR